MSSTDHAHHAAQNSTPPIPRFMPLLATRAPSAHSDVVPRRRRYMTHICEDCGQIAVANLDTNRFMCPNQVTCPNSNVFKIEIPYAAKLLFQELMAMQIAVRLMTTWPGEGDGWALYDK
jgi:NAD-dependent DNA ligase